MDDKKINKIKDTSWELFSKTGEIKYYGAYKSASEMENEMMQENENQREF